jgi:hypothetical protein
MEILLQLMKKQFLYIFFFILFVSGCNQKPGNFSVSAPQGWIVSDSIFKTKGRIVSMHPSVELTTIPQFVENIRITINHSFDVDLYVSGVTALVKKDALFFEDKGKGIIKINSYEIRWVHHIVQYKKNDSPIEQKGYFIGDSGNIYMIVCSSKTNEMEKLQSKIDEVLESFKVL